MSNLLPINAQNRVKSLYRARLVIALALALLVIAAMFLLALIPSYLALTAVAPQEPAANAPRHSEENKAVMRAQTIVSQVLPILSATSTPSTFLEAALTDVPAGVTVSRISYAKKASGGTLTLVGSAPREKVAAFRDALATRPLFKSATVPVSSLVGAGAGQFSLTLEIAGSSE